MRIPLFVYYTGLTITFVVILVITQLLVDNTTVNETSTLRFTPSPPPTPPPHEEKLIHDYHQRTRTVQSKSLTPDTSGCGVGWMPDDRSCIRDIKTPSVVDPGMQDITTNQCTDFFTFSCGAFNKDPFNAEKDTTFMYTHQVAANTMRFIVSNIVNSSAPDQSKISGFHHACMDHGIEEEDFRRSSTLQDLLRSVDTSVKSYVDLASMWGKLQRYDTILPLELTFELNPFDSTQLIPMIKQSGLFDDSAVIDTPEHLQDVTARLSVIANPLVAAEWAKQVVSIERVISANAVRVPAYNIIEYIEKQHGADDIIEDWITRFSHVSQNGFDVRAFVMAANPDITPSSRWIDAVSSRPMWVYRASFIDHFPSLMRRFSVASWIAYTKHAILFHIDNGNDAPRIDPESHYAYHRQYDSRYSLPWLQPRRFLMQHTPVSADAKNGDGAQNKGSDISPSSTKNENKGSNVSPPSTKKGGGSFNDLSPSSAKKGSGSFNDLSPSSTKKEKNENETPLVDEYLKQEACLSLTEAYLPVVLDNYFVNSYLPDSAKRTTLDIANHIKSTFVEMILGGELLPTIPELDRVAMASKIESVRIQIGTPNVWPIDRSALLINPESYAESVLLIRRYHVDKNYRFFMGHVNGELEVNGDTLFDGLVSNANAYYQHQINTIIITAGLIQPPVFSTMFDTASSYSRFGVTIAHELAHSIDSVGVLFDTTGTYKPWLSKEANDAYAEFQRCLVNTYSVQTPLGNKHDGKRTLNENIADVLGFSVAYKAFTEYNSVSTLEKRNFFLSYAQMYCAPTTKEQEYTLITRRSHSLSYFRVNNIVSTHSEFDSIWECSRYDRNNNLRNKCTHSI